MKTLAMLEKLSAGKSARQAIPLRITILLAATFLAALPIPVYPQDSTDIGKGRATTSSVEEFCQDGRLLSVTRVEERHIDVRHRVTETMAADEEGGLVPQKRVTVRTDRYRGSVRIEEEPLVPGGDFVVVRVETNVRDEQGAAIREIRAWDEEQRALKLVRRERTTQRDDGSSLVVIMEPNASGRLVTIKREVIETE